MTRTKPYDDAGVLISEFLRAMDRTPVIGATIAKGGCNKALARSAFETAAKRLHIALSHVAKEKFEDGDLRFLTGLVASMHENLDRAEAFAIQMRVPEGEFDESVLIDNLQGLDRHQLQLVGRITCEDTEGLYPKQIAEGFEPFVGICDGFAAEEMRDSKKKTALFLAYLVFIGILTLKEAKAAAKDLKRADDAVEGPEECGDGPAAKDECTSKSIIPLSQGRPAEFLTGRDEVISVKVNKLAAANPNDPLPTVEVNDGSGAIVLKIGDRTKFLGEGRRITVVVKGRANSTGEVEICRKPAP